MNDDLRRATENVLRRAEAQGTITSSEVRAELAALGLGEDLWKDVLAGARTSLRFADGVYHFQAPVTGRAAAEKGRLDAVVAAIRGLLDSQRRRGVDRRGEERVEYVHPATVLDDAGGEHRVLTRDLSPTGVRLIGTRRLLGQKVRLRLEGPGSEGAWVFRVQVVWTAEVGDDLFENGGAFLGLES